MRLQRGPFESYASAWQQFRALSDESKVTADHLLARSRWPRSSNLRVADFGCGDGRLIEALIQTARQSISTLYLTEINPELLEQAGKRIARLGRVKNVFTACTSAGVTMLELAKQMDVALAIHLLYFPSEQETHQFLSGLAPGVPLFVVLDHPSSVFMQLLERTAPKDYERSLNAHSAVAELCDQGYAMEQTNFDTHLTNPFDLEKETRDAVLSFLCYRNFRDLDADTQSWVESVVSKHNMAGQIACNCVCYELVRPS